MLKSESHPHAAGNASSAGAAGTAGEGIGLSIVKRLCELLDATLELETALGAGTTFRVVLPCAYSSPAPPLSNPIDHRAQGLVTFGPEG